MEFRVLGSLEVRQGQRAVPVGGHRLRAVLAALLVQAGRVVPVDALIEALWGEQPPTDPRNAIQTYVARLRQCADGDLPLVTRSPGYCLDVDPEQVDALRFERLLADARRRRDRPADARPLLEEALGLWRGPAYAEFADDVARSEALRLEEQRLAAGEELAAARLALGEADALVGQLESEVAAHPLRERFVELLMTALAAADRQADALAAHRAYRDRLAEETGLEPSASIRRLEEAVLRGELAGPAARGGAPSEAASPPSPDAGAEPDRPSRIPSPSTSLVGREVEIAELRATLGHQRVVTLAGAGGVGKSRLASAVAHAEQRAGREVGWVDLAAVTDAHALEHVTAAALGIDLGGRPPRPALLEALAGRRLLVVLDNAEHLLEAVAALVDEVQRTAPQVRVLTTSRERLALDGEQVMPVTPLETGAWTDEAEATPAVQLFLDRAGAVGQQAAVAARLPTVAAICRELDGLPLAIELAAARTSALAPEDLLAALREDPGAAGGRRGRPARHRDLWAVVDWSFRLLEEDARVLFARLGVFAGGFGLEEAHAVAAPDEWARSRTREQLAALSEQSLVAGPTDGRYRLLRPLRAYARQRLADRDELAALTDRHARVLTDHAEAAAGPPLSEPGRHWLEASLDDLREIARRARRAGDLALLGRLVAALYRFDYWRPGRELLSWAEEALALDGADAQPTAPQLYAAAAATAWMAGDLDRGQRLAEHGTRLGAGPDDPARTVAFEAVGDVATFAGRLADAETAFGEEVRLARPGGDTDSEVVGMASAAIVRAYDGRVDEGVELADAAELVAEQAGAAAHAFARYARGECRADRDPEVAIDRVQEAIGLARACDAWFVEGVARVTAASLWARHGETTAALPAFAELIRHWQRSGSWTQQWTTLRNLAELLVRLGADEPAVTIAAATAAKGRDTAVFGAESDRLEDALTTARQRLGETRFANAHQRGAHLPAHEVVELARTAVDEAADAAGRRP